MPDDGAGPFGAARSQRGFSDADLSRLDGDEQTEPPQL